MDSLVTRNIFWNALAATRGGNGVTGGNFSRAFLYLRRQNVLSAGEALTQHVSMTTIYFSPRYIFLPRKTKRPCEI